MGEKKSRYDFLKDLAEFLKGDLNQMEEQVSSYAINFKFEGKEFVYEDVEAAGFINNVNCAYLKSQSTSKLTLELIERERSKFIKTQMTTLNSSMDKEKEICSDAEGSK